MKAISVQIQVDVQAEKVSKLLTLCFDPSFNAVRQWATITEIFTPVESPLTEIPLNGGEFKINVPRFPGDVNSIYVLDCTGIEKGLQEMSVQDPDHFSDILNDELTCETADTFLQFCLFGTIVFQ